MRIREFEAEDFEPAYRLDQSCYPPSIAYTRFALREFLAMPGAQSWVAEEEDKLVGLVIVRRLWAGRGHVITLDVREDKRRRGTGRQLLARGEEWLREQGVRRVRLETAVDNPAALAFWQRMGYEAIGRVARYYAGRTDAYRMEKQL